MTFIHAYLLGGLLLAGLPVLLHLIKRQQPRRVRFPAFRFLKARQQTNKRRMRLQHLLLLLLRVLVIAVLCLALARPRLFSQRLGSSDRPVIAVLLIDTSPSMEYTVAGVTRLDEAKGRARELLEEMPPGSRVAILDSGEDRDEAFLPPIEARTRLDGLRIRYDGGALNRPIERAMRWLQKESASESEDVPRLLFVFSDRTRACYDPGGPRPQVPEGMQVLFVDVGVETPRDLAIDQVEIVPPLVPPGARVEVRVRVRGIAPPASGGQENELLFRIDNDPDIDRLPERKLIALEKGVTSDLLVFERKAPEAPADGGDVVYQVSVRLGTKDALPFNNARHASFKVRGRRRLLTLTDKVDPQRQPPWNIAHLALKSFANESKTFAQVQDLSAQDLSRYSVVCLLQPTQVPAEWWKRVADYARGGGGVVMVPGGDELLGDLAVFNKEGLATEVLPAELSRLITAPQKSPALWQRFSGEHALAAPFVAWARQADPDFDRDDLRPLARRYWRLNPLAKDAVVINSFADSEKNPALVERRVGRGKVVLFSSPLDFRVLKDYGGGNLQWNNYWQGSSFGFVLIDQVCLYLAGESSAVNLNFLCGRPASVRLPSPLDPPYQLLGPGLTGSERNLPLPRGDEPLSIGRAVQPGNYLVQDGKKQNVAGFSLAVPAAESDLERVPVDELERDLGAESVIQIGREVRLREALAKYRPPPLELLPLLMFAMLAVLTVENWVSNRFYRRKAGAEKATAEAA